MRSKQIIIGIIAIIVSWYVMMAVHEAGHCLGALATGAKIKGVSIPIAGFSRTDVSGGNHPLVVVWSGPLFGAVAPLLLLPTLRVVSHQIKQLLMFFIGFCLLANGAYIGLGAFISTGDCRELLNHGSPMWLLLIFGLLSSSGGLYMWHRLGPFSSWFGPEKELQQKINNPN